MGKINKSIRRSDSENDHVHALPNGELTGGTLHKPSKDQYDMHAHLFEHEENTDETGPAHNDGDHTHSIKWQGEVVQTSGPRPVPKKPGESWEKMDSLQREGSKWVVRSTSGRIVMRSDSKEKCQEFMKEQNG